MRTARADPPPTGEVQVILVWLAVMTAHVSPFTVTDGEPVPKEVPVIVRMAVDPEGPVNPDKGVKVEMTGGA